MERAEGNVFGIVHLCKFGLQATVCQVHETFEVCVPKLFGGNIVARLEAFQSACDRRIIHCDRKNLSLGNALGGQAMLQTSLESMESQHPQGLLDLHEIGGSNTEEICRVSRPNGHRYLEGLKSFSIQCFEIPLNADSSVRHEIRRDHSPSRLENSYGDGLSYRNLILRLSNLLGQAKDRT